MFWLSDKIEKGVGQSYSVELDRGNFTVTVCFKGKAQSVHKFTKFYESVNFYASIKTVKAAKAAIGQET